MLDDFTSSLSPLLSPAFWRVSRWQHVADVGTDCQGKRDETLSFSFLLPSFVSISQVKRHSIKNTKHLFQRGKIEFHQCIDDCKGDSFTRSVRSERKRSEDKAIMLDRYYLEASPFVKGVCGGREKVSGRRFQVCSIPLIFLHYLPIALSSESMEVKKTEPMEG